MIRTIIIGYTAQGESDTWNPEHSGNRVHKSRIPRQSNTKFAVTAGKPTFIRERIVYKRRMARKSTSFRFPETNARSSTYGCSSIGSAWPAAVGDDKHVTVGMTTTAAATLIGTTRGDVSNLHLPAVLIRAIVTRRTADGPPVGGPKIVGSVRAKSVTRAGHKVVNGSSSNATESTACKNTMSIEDDVSSAVATTTEKKVTSVVTAATTTGTPVVVTSPSVKRATGTISSGGKLRKKNTDKIKNGTEITKNKTDSTESTDAAELTNVQQTTDADGAATNTHNKDLATLIVGRTTNFGNSATLLKLRPAASSLSPSKPVTDPTVRKNWLGKVTALFTNRSVRDKKPSVTTDGTAEDRDLNENAPQLPGRYESEEYKMNWKSFVPIPACGGFVGTWKSRRNDRNTGHLISGADKHG